MSIVHVSAEIQIKYLASTGLVEALKVNEK